MSIVVKGNHPLAEIIARKLFGINSVSNKERDAMVSRCVKEACCYVERLESDNERLRTHLAGLQKQIKDGKLVPVIDNFCRPDNELYEKAPWWAHPNLPPPVITCGTSKKH